MAGANEFDGDAASKEEATMSDDHYEGGMPVIHNRRCTCDKCCPGTKDELIQSLKERPAKTAEELASRIVGAALKMPDKIEEGGMTNTFTLIIERWQVKPKPEWIFHSERKVTGRLTAKRVLITEGLDKGKVFDRSTGCEIKRSGDRSWY